MALSPIEHPIRGGLRLAPGSLSLIGARWLLVAGASLPALAAAVAGLSSEPARAPYFTEGEGRLDLLPLMRLFGELPSVFPMALLAAGLAVLGDQILTPGALSILRQDRDAGRRRILSAVCREGLAHLGPCLRCVACGLLAGVVGVAAIRAASRGVEVHGMREGWTASTLRLTLPGLWALMILLWLAGVGSWVLWSRALTVLDGRRRVRRTGLIAARLLWRRPARGLAFFVVATLGSTLMSGALLAAWFHAEPRSPGAVTGWLVAWLLALGGQAFVWHWILRSVCLVAESADLADLRARPDAPLGLVSLLGRWRRRPVPAATSAPGGARDR